MQANTSNEEYDRLMKELAKSVGAKKFKNSLAGEDKESDDEEMFDDEDDGVLNIEDLDAMESQNDKMNWFVNEFGVNMDIPSFYVQDAKVFPQDPSYCLMVVSYVISDDPVYLRTHKDKKGYKPKMPPPKLKDDKYFNHPRFKGASLKIMQKKDKAFVETGKEVHFMRAKKVVIEFSPDGRYLAVLQKKINVLDIWDLDALLQEPFNCKEKNIEQYLDAISYHYRGVKHDDQAKPMITFEGDKDFLSTKNLEYDLNNRYLMCYGQNRVNIINLSQYEETGHIERVFKLDTDYFSTIKDVQFVSNEDENGQIVYRCEVACRMKEHKIIVIFDIEEDQTTICSNQDYTKQIAYLHDDSQNLRVKISNDFTQAVLVNKAENYILELETEEDDDEQPEENRYQRYHQRVMGWLKGKSVKKIEKEQYITTDYIESSRFYFVCCKDYDEELDFYRSDDEDFKVSVARQIEPGVINVYDLYAYQDDDDGECKLICLSLRDEDFFIDTVNASQWQMEKYYLFSKFRAVSTNWPYMAFQGLEYNENKDKQDNFVWLINAYQTQIVNRIQLPKYLVQICFTYLCETNYDLYVVGEANNTYELFHIDLNMYSDSSNKNDFNRLFRYTILAKIDKEQRQNDPTDDEKSHELSNNMLIGFHVKTQRASDDDENAEDKCTVLLLYQGINDEENSIWVWQLGQGNKIEWVCDTKTKSMTRLNDETVIFRDDIVEKRTIYREADDEGEEEDQPEMDIEDQVFLKNDFIIKQIKIEVDFNSYTIDDIYTQNQLGIGGEVKAYAYDYHREVLITLQAKKSGKTKQNLCRVFDIRNQKLLWQSKVRNSTLMGRLKSSLYTLVDGHIYYNNDLIKVRYDLLEQKNSKDLEEDQIFDYYENIFNLDDHETFYTKMPICSLRFHRMVYVTKNRKQLTHSKVLMIPFLHERKIYLNRNNDDEKYFYTTIRQPSEDAKSLQNLFITMCITSSKYYVYNMKGIRKSRVDYKNIIKEYGDVKAVSQNGQVFVLKKTKKEGKIKMWQLSIFVLTPDEFVHIKTFTVQNAVLKYLEDVRKDSSDVLEKEISQVTEKMYLTQIKQKKDKYNLRIQINNNLDVAVQVYQKKESAGKGQAFQKEPDKKLTGSAKQMSLRASRSQILDIKNQVGSFLYFQKGSIGFEKTEKRMAVLEDMGIDCETFLEDKKPKIDKQFCFFTMKKVEDPLNPTGPKKLNLIEYYDENNVKQLVFDESSNTYNHFSSLADRFEKGLYGYALSNEYVFFWNDFKIFYIQFNKTKEEQEISAEESQTSNVIFKKLKLTVDPKNLQTQIKKVRTSSDNQVIVIQIQQSASSDCFMQWDVVQDREYEAFDLPRDHGKVFFDALGKAYLTEQIPDSDLDKVYNMQQGVALTCYDVRNVNRQSKEEVKKTQLFGYHYGNRFDYQGHSWLYLRDYISISYSYMTFVIKRKIHDEDNDFQQDDYQFDIEQYNYMVNCKTALTDDDNLIKENTELLDYILKNFEQANPVLLEQIQYYHYEKVEKVKKVSEEGEPVRSQSIESDPNEDPSLRKKKLFASTLRDKDSELKIVTPLHIAHMHHNNRSTKILLQYMAKLDYNAMHHYRDIIHELVDVNGFTEYLWELPFQTLQMQNKQNLRIEDPYNEQIVAVNYSVTSYVDDAYYSKFFFENQEDPDYKKYPVKITALQVHWITDIIAGHEEKSDGKKFLDALINSDNIDIFGIPAINMIIEFLYQHYREDALEVVYVYAAQLFLFFLTILLNENEYDEIHEKRTLEDGSTKTYVLLERRDHTSVLLIIVATLSMGFSFGLLLNQLKLIAQYDGIEKLLARNPVFFDDVVFVDILSAMLNIFITCCIYYFMSVDEKDGYESGVQSWVRQFQGFTGILYTYRILYFMKIHDKIAPLVFIVKQVMIDIIYFLVVMLFILIAFANAFYLLGRNQVIYDNIEEGDEPIYHQFSGTIQYVYLLCLGEIGADDANFTKGDPDNVSSFYFGWALFVFATFIIIVTMMNMLIAIMGTTFENNMEVEEENLAREHLKFVVNHWYLKPLEKPEIKGKINYLIVAFLEEEVEENEELLNELYEDMSVMRKQHDKDMNDIKDALKIIKNAQM